MLLCRCNLFFFAYHHGSTITQEDTVVPDLVHIGCDETTETFSGWVGGKRRNKKTLQNMIIPIFKKMHFVIKLQQRINSPK